MIDRHSAVDYLIAAVAVDIAHAEIMVALIGVFYILLAVGQEFPTLHQSVIYHIIGNERSRAAVIVITAAHNNARIHTVKISHAGQETVNAVTPAVAPFAYIAARLLIIGRIYRRACSTVKYSQIFRPFKDKSILVAIIGILVAYHVAYAVNRTIGSFADNLRLTIVVEVVGHHLRVVRTGTDVYTQIYPPQLSPVQLIRIQQHLARIALVRIIFAVSVPAQDYLIFAVAVEIRHGSVICRILIYVTVGGMRGSRLVKRDRQIRLFPYLDLCAGFLCLALMHRLYGVCIIDISLFIKIIGAVGQRFFGYKFTVSFDDKINIFLVFPAVQSPA